MANSLLTPVQIVRESLRVLHNNLVFVKGITRQYSDEFGRTGAKIGSTVNVRKPNRYFIRKGPVAQVQSTNETYVPLTLNTQWGADVAFGSAELTLSLDDFSKRVLAPQMAKLASQIDFDCLQGAALGYYTANTGVVKMTDPVYSCVGTGATTPGTAGGSATGLSQYNAPIVYLNAGMQMDNAAAPRDENRRIVLNPAAHAQSVAGLSGLFNDSGSIGEQYRKGVLGNALGFEFAMDQNIPVLTCGTRAISGEITVQATWTSGSTLALTGGTATIKAGDVFTCSSVYAVNPENQQSTGQLMQFVVTSDVTMSGTTTVSIYPTPKVAGAGIADGNVTRVPTTSDTIVWATGATGAVTPQNLAYHQDAFTLATADLEIPGGVDFAARETYDGISMRIVRAYDVNQDQLICRLDVLGGFSVLRPELAVRICG
jgi:hypothetical protein